MWSLGHTYLSVHQESDGQCHVQSTFRLDLDGLHLWLDMRRGRGQQERCWSQLIGDLSTPGLGSGSGSGLAMGASSQVS